MSNKDIADVIGELGSLFKSDVILVGDHEDDLVGIVYGNHELLGFIYEELEDRGYVVDVLSKGKKEELS